MHCFSALRLTTDGSPAACRAAELLRRFLPCEDNDGDGALQLCLCADAAIKNRDAFLIGETARGFRFTAAGLRGLIYAAGYFLRKTDRSVYPARAALRPGLHAPEKAIRGHQLGYRACSNTYDAWNAEQFERYFLELMFFGANTVEFIPYQSGASARGALMRDDEEELFCRLAAVAHSLELEVGVWLPNAEADEETALNNRERLFRRAPYLDALFIPGGDPGDLPAAEMLERTQKIAALLRRFHPDAAVWPSAQQPHGQPDWGADFLAWIDARQPAWLTGVITGPNAAFPLPELRRRLPARYPIRFYPDITHCLRCTHPVHYETDDWHYTFAAALGREPICPRPGEYTRLHREVSPYTVGSVTYSDGVNDDVNKAVWSALEWDGAISPEETLCDYARLFFPGADPAAAAGAIAGLEQNWAAPPTEETLPGIGRTLRLWESLCEKTPALESNWRFLQGRFRAECDCYIAKKHLSETSIFLHYKEAVLSADDGARLPALPGAANAETAALRQAADRDADLLYEHIGMQLSTGRHFASGWERGATLDTLDLPVSDLPWLQTQLRKAAKLPPASALRQLRRQLMRTDAGHSEAYFSFALHEVAGLGMPQQGEFYMNFQGDRPEVNNGTLPTCLFKVYDHLSLNARFTGLERCDYILTVTYKESRRRADSRHRVTANGVCVYEGSLYDVPCDEAYTEEFLPAGFTAARYRIPAAALPDGSLTLCMTEAPCGFEAAELRLTKAREREC